MGVVVNLADARRELAKRRWRAWCADRRDIGSRLTPAERAEIESRVSRWEILTPRCWRSIAEVWIEKRGLDTA